MQDEDPTLSTTSLLPDTPARCEIACITDSSVRMEEEDETETSSFQANVCIGDTICFRAVHRKMYVNLDDESSGITWHEESDSSQFTIYPAVGQPGNAEKEDCRAIHDGAVVCLFTPNGYFLSFDGERLAANRPYYVAGPSAEFIVHVVGNGALRNRGKLFLRNRASLQLLEVGHVRLSTGDDATGHGADNHRLLADGSEPGCLLVEKVFDKHAQADTTPRKVRRRGRFALVPKLPRYARRWSQECAYMCKPAFKKFMVRPAVAAT